ncbi:uncharacterized protein RHO25_003042 [Cercospora beticola]|uniref:F-box domain-containing protein n=1 Tax=Cercospora beticola TaxID=122368 RepID=A0ABZ0NFX0_CERBT|nr:hypothetical protein RHO25_003042 [Cercospora beticola]
MEPAHQVEALAQKVQSTSWAEGPLAMTLESDGIPPSLNGRQEQTTPTCFWDLPEEVRQMIYRRACPGYYINVQQIEGLTLLRACPHVRPGYLERCYRDGTFMLNLRNTHPEDRVPLWREFLDSMPTSSAGQLRYMVFYFQQFVLKIEVKPESEERLSFEYTPTYDDDYDKQGVYDPQIINEFTRRWIEFKLRTVKTWCTKPRFGKKDLNRIAKISFELVAYLHVRLWPRQFPGQAAFLDGVSDHAWECPACLWTREMVD